MTACHNSTLPLVTAYVGCYNHERFIIQALESVRAQKYPHLQLIICDDASTDHSQALIQNWINRYWPDALFLRHTRNVGVCRCNNEMVANARGKYITGVAGDDLWMPDKVLTQVKEMELLAPDVGVLYSDAYQIDENNHPLPKMFIESHRAFAQMPEGWIYDALVESNFIPGMAALIRRDAYIEAGPFDETLAFEDWDMWLRISRRFKFAYSHFISAQYRLVSNSMVRTQSAAMAESCVLILAKCLAAGWPIGKHETWVRNAVQKKALEAFKNNSRHKRAYLRYAYQFSKHPRFLIMSLFSRLGLEAKPYYKLKAIFRRTIPRPSNPDAENDHGNGKFLQPVEKDPTA